MVDSGWGGVEWSGVLSRHWGVWEREKGGRTDGRMKEIEGAQSRWYELVSVSQFYRSIAIACEVKTITLVLRFGIRSHLSVLD